MSLYDSGIVMTNGFAIAGQKPADLKFLADTIADRDKYVTDNLAYEGMLVYVKEDTKTYQRMKDGWKEFGFNTESFEGSLYDGLDSNSTILALTANQGRVLNEKINSHTNDNVKHITSAERTTWNAKANSSLATQTANGLMSIADKKKLDGIQSNANNYIHPDSHAANMIDEDATHRFVSDAEKATWNNKLDHVDNASTTAHGLMSKEDKKKLDGIAEGATKYTHPSTHPAAMIIEDETHRFVTDTDKTNWNNKLDHVDNASTTAHGLMSKEDKKKLDGIAEGATKYTHPANHPANIITQDTSHRFVTDAQIDAWNAKPGSTDLVSPTNNGLMRKEDKAKLDGIEANANNYTHPSNHPATIITQTATHRFVSDTQINYWNAKASTVVTQTTNGLMIAADKSKLDGIEDGANNYKHPANHPASMITQDATHKFVTDEQIAAWNAKANSSLATQTANGLMSIADKKKLDGIASGATNYKHPDTHPANMITEDATRRFVSDNEKNTWNAFRKEIDDLKTTQTQMLAKLKTAVFYE